VTISALIATGQIAQLGGHLNRAMDNGLTQTQAAEVVTHLAFYAGWKNNPVLPVETRSTTNYKAILVPLNKHGKSSRALLIRCTAFSSSPALLPRCAHRNFSRFAGQTCYGTRTGLR